MATPQDSARGKTGGFELTKQCDLCSSTNPTKYCPECEVQLCKTCIGTHGKLKATQDHPLLDINLLSTGLTYAKSGDCESGLGHCVKHPNETLQFYCNNCAILICAICHMVHKKHSVQNANDDLKLYQSICTDHIKKLLDKAHDLQENKVLIEGIFSSYDEAIELVHKWEKELQDLVKECSQNLTEELKKVKNKWENILNDKDDGIMDRIGEVEDKLSKLHNIRKVSDVDIFSHELALSQELLQKQEYFQIYTLPKLTVPTLENILPRISQLPELKTGIKNLMSTMSPNPARSPKPAKCKDQSTDQSIDTKTPTKVIDPHSYPDLEYRLAVKNPHECNAMNFDSMNLQDFVGIPSPDSRDGYRFNQFYHYDKSIMLFGNKSKDICIFNLDNHSLVRFTSEVNIDDIISMDRHNYIAIMKGMVFFLDFRFKVMHMPELENVYGLAFLSTNRFATLEPDQINSQKVTISIIHKKDYKLKIEKKLSFDVAERMKLITPHQDGTSLYICGARHLYKINLRNGTTEHLDLITWLKNPLCIFAVGDDVLIGGYGGKVHRFRNMYNYNLVVNLKIPPIRDVYISNGYLLVSTQENKMLMYK